jgi:hypothetical protein
MIDDEQKLLTIDSNSFSIFKGECKAHEVKCGKDNCQDKDKFCIQDKINVCSDPDEHDVSKYFKKCKCPGNKPRHPETLECVSKDELSDFNNISKWMNS